MSEEKELVPHVEGSLAPVKEPLLGFEEPEDKNDIILPRAKLLQALSPEVVECKEGCKAGGIINSVTSEVLTQVFIPIFKFTEYIKWNPRNKQDPNFDIAYEPGAMIWKTTDPHDPRTAECEFGPNGEKPTANKYMNFLAYFPGTEMPVVISFAKTSYTAGKKLYTLAKIAGVNMFERKYKLFSKPAESNGNKYFVLDVETAGQSTKEELRNARAFYDSLKNKPIQTHQEAETTGEE